MQVDDNTIEKVAVAMVGIFFVYALWEQFAPQPPVGSEDLAKAYVLAQSSDKADQKEACAFFGRAVREGNREAALGLSDCIGRSNDGTPSSRRALRYAVLTLAIDDIASPEQKKLKTLRDPVKEREDLGATPEEIKEASKIDVVKVLQGEVSVLDFALRALH